MNLLSFLLSLIGGLFMILVAFALTLAAWGYACESLDKLVERLKKQGEVEAVKRLGMSLQNYAYWFTEHTPTWKGFEALGKQLQDYGHLEVQTLRDDWRRLLTGSQSADKPEP